MSIEALSFVWKQSKQSGSHLLMLLAIADHANNDFRSWPSVIHLATKARLSKRQTQRVLQDLENDGEIKILVGQGPYGTNIFQILQGGDDAYVMGGVTSTTHGGDTGVMGGMTPMSRGGMTPMSPKPSVQPSIESSVQPQESSPELISSKPFEEEIFDLYPKRGPKKEAVAIIRALLKSKRVKPDVLLAKTKEMAARWKGQTDLQFCAGVVKWFKNERFNDPPETWGPWENFTQAATPTEPPWKELDRLRDIKAGHICNPEYVGYKKGQPPEKVEEYKRLKERIKELEEKVGA